MSVIQIDEKFSGWTVRQVIVGTLTVLGIGLGFWLFYRFYFVFFSLLVAIMLHIAMKPLVETLYRWGVARKLGVVLVYVLLSIFVAGFVGLLVPMLGAQFQLIGLKLPVYYQSGRDFLQHSTIRLFPILASYLPSELSLAHLPFATTPAAGGPDATTWLTISSLGETIFITISVLMMAFYWTLDRDRILYTLLLSAPM
jgi:predicted PurR-regulated permease PerM